MGKVRYDEHIRFQIAWFLALRLGFRDKGFS